MLSFVIPTKNNETTVREVFLQICNQCSQLEEEFEVIFIDNSSDKTWSKLIQLVESNPTTVRVIQLRKGTSKSAAYRVGFHKAIGDIVFTLSATLKDDPVAIPKFLNELRKGNDLVIGHKKQNHLSKLFPSRMLNKIASFFSGIDLNHYNSDFVCYRIEVIRMMTEQGGVDLQKNFPLSASIEGYQVSEIYLKDQRWQSGHNRYNLLEYSTLSFLKYHPERPQRLISYVVACLFLSGISLVFLDLVFFPDSAILSVIGLGLVFNTIPLSVLAIVLEMQTALLSHSTNVEDYSKSLICYDSAESLGLIKTNSQKQILKGLDPKV